MVDAEVDGIVSLSTPYSKSLSRMNELFQDLSALVPAPKKTIFRGGWVYRYEEKTIRQAIVLKAARYLSGLSAAQTLLHFGFLQDFASIQRIMHELHEDVCYMASALIFNDVTDDHNRFLESFFQEETLSKGENLISKNRPTLSRKKIQDYLAKKEAPSNNQAQAKAASRTIYATYSGYLHGAAPNILESYFGSPPRFHTNGQRESPFFADHDYDLWNQHLWGWNHLILSSKALLSDELMDRARSSLADFQQETGRNY